MKALGHTLKNYDGGQKFYQSNDIHQGNQKVLQENMKVTLNRQKNSKDEEKQQQRDKK